MWNSIIVVITKVIYNSDEYDDIGEWIDEMESYKNSMKSELKKHFKDAHPTVLAISQDITKPKRKENKEGTEQHNYMLAQMDKIYALAA